MTRTLTAQLVTNISRNRTLPTYLVEVGFSTPQRYSTRGDLSWDSKSWSGARGVVVENLQESGGRVSFSEVDDFFTSLAFSEGVKDKSIDIYTYYEGEAVLVFSGVTADYSTDGIRADLDFVASVAGRARIPKRKFTPEEFSFLPVVGQTFLWADLRITIEEAT